MSTTDPQVEPYRWMFEWSKTGDGIVDHRAWQFKEVREAYEDLPETSATFKTKTLTEETDAYGNSGESRIVGNMVAYLGSWRCPERFTQSRRLKWVNHRAKWAPKYSDAAITCPCGSTKYYTENRMAGENFDEKHTDDCTRIDYHRANMVIWQRRKRILHQCAWNHLPQARAAERMDLSAEAVSSHCRLLNVDYEPLQVHGYRKWRATMIILRDRFGIYNRDLGDIFGHARTTIRDHINQDLDIYDNHPPTPTPITAHD